MKTSFNSIQERLEDSFFEIQVLGKEAIRQRTLPIDKYNGVSDAFQFMDWLPEDNGETIQYSFHNTEIGRILLANTSKGICFLGFACKSQEEIMADFMHRFLRQPMEEKVSGMQKLACEYCNGNHTLMIPLHLKGTDFQVEIWKQLVRIPEGSLYVWLSVRQSGSCSGCWCGSGSESNKLYYTLPSYRKK